MTTENLSGGEPEDNDGEPGVEVNYGAEGDFRQPSVETSPATKEDEDIDVTQAYEYAYGLASAGRVDSLKVQNNYLIEEGICTPKEYNEMLFQALTVRIGQLIGAAQAVENQISYIRKVLEIDDGHSLESGTTLDELYGQMLELHNERTNLIEKIKEERLSDFQKAAETIIQSSNNPDSN